MPHYFLKLIIVNYCEYRIGVVCFLWKLRMLNESHLNDELINVPCVLEELTLSYSEQDYSVLHIYFDEQKTTQGVN